MEERGARPPRVGRGFAGPAVTGATPPQATDRIILAGSDVAIPPLGVGTWAWGDKGVWGMGGYDQSLTESTIHDAWEASIEAGVVFFDTAEVYGSGESERIIGRLLASDPTVRSSVVIATKFMPSPWKVNVHARLLSAARQSLERLGCDTIDLYQIHGPISLRSHDAFGEALAAAHAEGLVKAVGVSNYSAKETRSMDAALRKRGLRLASNQIEFSLLRTMPRRVGLLDCCRELGVVPLAYSPIGQGRLTGKYTASNPPPGGRTFSAHPMEQVDAIVAELRRIGEAHDGRTPSQVALAWLIAQGAVPIPGAKNRSQAEQNAGALGWQMTDDELARLDDASLFGKRGISQRVWQHG
jgi:aryl-alcohol dehydrogenase-like predicted oxidoreductase